MEKTLKEELWNNLHKLDKNELAHFIFTYYEKTYDQASSQMNDKVNYRMEEYGRIRMTDLIFLRNLLHYKLEGGVFAIAKIEELRPSDDV